jgi:hypothetical protein
VLKLKAGDQSNTCGANRYAQCAQQNVRGPAPKLSAFIKHNIDDCAAPDLSKQIKPLPNELQSNREHATHSLHALLSICG